jgi:hypothetical protein
VNAQLLGKPMSDPKLAENRPEIMSSINDAAQKIINQMNLASLQPSN